MNTDAMDIFLKEKSSIGRSRRARPASSAWKASQKYTITAGRVSRGSSSQNRLSGMNGSRAQKGGHYSGAARSHYHQRDLVAGFDSKGPSACDQSGDFHYEEGRRRASADRAHFVPAEDNITLPARPALLIPA